MRPTIATIIQQHVTLSTTCLDRLYLNGYLPRLQTPGQLCWFLREHLGNPIPSPALFRPLHDRFVAQVTGYAQQHQVPLIPFARGQRKDDLAAEQRAQFSGSEGVVFIGVAQEKASSFKASKSLGPQGGVHFGFSRQPVAVNHYYFYVQDPEWGPAFLKIGTYLPYPVKLCLNGHEWVKQQLRREGLGFTSLDNGFLACDDPARLQTLCNRLGPADVLAFFDRWIERLPWPLTAADRAAGYRHRLTLWQLEVSQTQVFEQPVDGRHFFEAVIRENLDLGRPERVSLLFPGRMTRRTAPPTHGYRTRVITAGVNPSLHVEYKRSHVKQYFKEERALRTETTINNPTDFRMTKGLDNLDRLRTLGQQINTKLLEVERLSQDCVLNQAAYDALQRPRHLDGQRVPALRFGDPRVLALGQALCRFAHLVAGFRNQDLRQDVAAALGPDTRYTAGAMTYDLRLRGLIQRLPGTNRYTVTTLGLRVALFYSKVHLRILRPGWAALVEPDDGIPRPLHLAFAQVDRALQHLADRATLSSPPGKLDSSVQKSALTAS
jgi:hypothetical protein